MANPTADSWSIVLGTPNRLVLHAGLQNFSFPLAASCPLPIMPGDIAALQAHDDQAVAAAVDKVLAALGSLGQGGTATADPGGSGGTTVPGGTGGTTTPPPASGGGTSVGQTNIEVGPGAPSGVLEIADAIGQIASTGGKIMVRDGTYTKSFHCETPDVWIESISGNPGKCVVDGQYGYGGGHRMAWGKSMFHFGAPFTVKRIGFVRCGGLNSTRNYSNEAAIYAELFPKRGVGHVIECTVDDSGNGFFVPEDGNVDWLDEGCIMGFLKPNGQNSYAKLGDTGPAHDRYLSAATVIVRGALSYGNVGHSVKSRSADTLIEDSFLVADGGRAAESANGGKLILRRCTLRTRIDRTGQGGRGGLYGNSNLIGYADEGAEKGVINPVLDGCTLLLDRLNSTIYTGGGATLQATNTTVSCFGNGSLQIQGGANGISGASAPPGAPAIPALPTPPAWFKP